MQDILSVLYQISPSNNDHERKCFSDPAYLKTAGEAVFGAMTAGDKDAIWWVPQIKL